MVVIRENPDKAFVREMRHLLRSNNGYCPCAIDKSSDTKCKCLEFRSQVERGELGPCQCGIYFAVEEDEEE